MPSNFHIGRGGIYQQADVERTYSNMLNSISDGMSSYDAADGYYGGSTVYTSASPPRGLQVAVVAGLAVGGVGLLIFFIVLCCVCCKHKSGGRILRAPPAPAASAPQGHVHEHHNPLSYAGAAPPSSGPALYPVPPVPAVVPLGVFYSEGQHAVAPDQPPAYNGERPLLADF